MIEAVTTSPLFGIVLCIGTFQIGRWVQKKTGLTLANPLVIAILLCIGVLLIFDIPYEDFAIGGDIVNMMLGPATAVLALNIYNQYAGNAVVANEPAGNGGVRWAPRPQCGSCCSRLSGIQPRR